MTLPGYLVVGGAGFIGSHLVSRLVERAEVTVIDDLSSGRREFLEAAIATGRCELREGSVFDAELLVSAMRGKIAVFHLSAWRGDIPHCRLDASALAALGFAISRSSDVAVEPGIGELSREFFA